MPTPVRITVPAGTRRTECRGCSATVYWVELPSGKRAPVSCHFDEQCAEPTATEDGVGVNHFVDCPERERFKAAKSGRMQPGRRGG